MATTKKAAAAEEEVVEPTIEEALRQELLTAARTELAMSNFSESHVQLISMLVATAQSLRP